MGREMECGGNREGEENREGEGGWLDRGGRRRVAV